MCNWPHTMGLSPTADAAPLFLVQGFTSPFFMVLVMCVLYSAFFTVYKLGFCKDKTLLPTKVFGKDADRSLKTSLGVLCIAYGLANSLTKMSLQFVSVPTQIVFKSCKLVAVMLGSTVILNKSYSVIEYVIALGLVVGMMSFAFADRAGSATGASSEADQSSIVGLALLVLSLCFDSVLGNLQEKFQKGQICDENVLMYVQSVFSTGLLVVWTGISGELHRGLAHCWRDVNVMGCLLSWGVLNIIGTVALLKVAGEFSAVTAVLTAFIRKFSSLMFSYMLYPKPFNAGHALGLVLVFGSVGAHSYHKISAKTRAGGVNGESGGVSEGGKGDVETGELLQQGSEHHTRIKGHVPANGANVATGAPGAGKDRPEPTSPQLSSVSHRTPPSPQQSAAPYRSNKPVPTVSDRRLA